jgi:hypothetical protein
MSWTWRPRAREGGSLYRLPDEGHGFARPVNNIAFFGVAEAFLSAHLGGMYLPLTKAELEASTMQIKEGKDGIPGLP